MLGHGWRPDGGQSGHVFGGEGECGGAASGEPAGQGGGGDLGKRCAAGQMPEAEARWALCERANGDPARGWTTDDDQGQAGGAGEHERGAAEGFLGTGPPGPGDPPPLGTQRGVAFDRAEVLTMLLGCHSQEQHEAAMLEQEVEQAEGQGGGGQGQGELPQGRG